MRFFLFIAFSATSVAMGVELDRKVYAECKDLTGTKFKVCQSEAFSKARLTAGSQEDAWAKTTEQNALGAPGYDWYHGPTAEDGRTGSSFVDCGAEQNKCIKNCDGNGECTQKCYSAIVGCAGGPTGISPVTKAEAPDGYIIDFDDAVNKAAP